MGLEDVASLCGALGVVPGLQWLWRRTMRNPKADAEARKLNVEAGDLIVARLYAEIDRLDRELGEMRKQLAEERRECDERIQAMEGRIRQLQQRQTSFGNLDVDKPLAGPLRHSFRPDYSDKDADLIKKLDQPRRKRRKP